MPLPIAVENALSASGLPYQVLDVTGHNARPADSVHAVILQDQNGRVLAMVPSDCLLDLAALNRFTGRDLSAASEESVNDLYAALGLVSTPAIPRILDLPTIVDKRLLQREGLTLESGAAGNLVRLSGSDFHKLVESGNTIYGDFTVGLDEIDQLPNDFDADIAAITNAVGKFTTRRIKARLEDTLDFPPLPEIAHRIIKISADPNASTKQLAQIVEIDPSLSAQVVSWASSPYYAAPGKIRSIQDAIVRVLGFDLVMNLALGLALGKTMRLPREGRYGYRNYWIQAVYSAALVDGLVKAMPHGKRPPVGFAYLAGLMHNFGFLMLAELFKPQLQLVCRYAEANPHIGHPAVERFLLGVTREQMCAWLMRFWHLPEEVCTALRFQNDPAYNGPHANLSKVLFVANRLLRQQGIGSAPAERVPDSIYSELGLSREDALRVSEHINTSSDDLKAIARDLAA